MVQQGYWNIQYTGVLWIIILTALIVPVMNHNAVKNPTPIPPPFSPIVSIFGQPAK